MIDANDDLDKLGAKYDAHKKEIMEMAAQASQKRNFLTK